MKKNIIATLLGFVATFIANTILAMTIIGPFLNAKIGISRDPEKDGLNFPAILVGYLLLTVVLVWLVPNVKGKTWLQKGLFAGVMTGLAVNVAGHLITAGWSIADGTSMLVAGIIDSFATIIGAIVIAFIFRNNEAK
ncbi:MAG: hypothetical protein HYU68_11015 [Bacteroidetes bacterium]|nr:hypothetical protein [Bacteroidota bacterium]